MKNNNLNENRVIVAMSGGVDSSVAAALLHKEGYEVIGITMKTWGFMEVGGAPKFESGCCSLDAIFDAKNVAGKFGIPHYTLDFTKPFENAVIDNFVDEYLAGQTPNPCVVCNRKIKWEELLEKADSLDAKYIATGHYATTGYNEKTGRYYVQTSEDARKDQTYALWGLSQESLSRTLFPLGKYTKPEIRQMAEDFGLKTSKKPDSQEICFVADKNYERFIRERLEKENINIEEGEIVYNNEVIGKHKGIPFYTVGQRKGLGLALGKPVYVKKINHKNNNIEVAEKEDLYEEEVFVKEVNFVSDKDLKPGTPVHAKIRYNDKGAPAEIIDCGDDNFSIKFKEPRLAVTPGQSCVIYDAEGIVLAGGIIRKN